MKRYPAFDPPEYLEWVPTPALLTEYYQRLALDRSEGGVLPGPSAFFCKHPPEQFTDDEAFRMVSEFITSDKSSSGDHKIYPLAGQQRTGSR